MRAALPPEKPRARHRPEDPQRVLYRLVVAGRQPVDESEVDGDGEDLEAVAAGADDHFALQIEAVAAQAHLEQQILRIEAEAALRVGDVGLRTVRDGPG